MKLHYIAGAMITFGLLCSCGTGSSSTDSASSSTTTGTVVEATTSNSAAQYYQESTNSTKLVYTGRMTLETTDFETTAQSLSDLVAQYGGYFSNSNVSQYSSNYRYGEYTVRIPSQYYDNFHSGVGDLSLVTQDKTTVEDISYIYYDTQGRLETQQIKLERLQALLEQATTMEDLITIESAISETQQEIDDLSGTMTYYDSMVDYATIDLYLNEVYQLSTVQEAPKTFGQRIANGLSQGGENFVDGVESFIVVIAYHWATILVLAVVAVVTLKCRKSIGKKRAKPPKITHPDHPKDP